MGDLPNLPASLGTPPIPKSFPKPQPNTIGFNRLISSLFVQLPGDIQKFHQLSDILKKDQEIKFKPTEHIKLIDCISDRINPYQGRAYLATDDKIYLCGNAIWKKFVDNDRKEVQTLLLHELIHFYDKKVKNINFYNPSDLACSEIRAYNITNVCQGDKTCILKKTMNSLRVAEASRFVNDNEKLAILSKVGVDCMKDESPFKMDFLYETSRERQRKFLAEQEEKKRKGGK